MNKITGSPLSQVFGGFNAPASNTFWGGSLFFFTIMDWTLLLWIGYKSTIVE